MWSRSLRERNLWRRKRHAGRPDHVMEFGMDSAPDQSGKYPKCPEKGTRSASPSAFGLYTLTPRFDSFL